MSISRLAFTSIMNMHFMSKFYCEQIIDISLPLNSETIIYPGNPPIEVETLTSKSGSVHSKISFGSHTGTHVDAPRHAFPKGNPIDTFSLSSYVGLCRVLDLTRNTKKIDAHDLEEKRIQADERILLKTRNSFIGYEKFRDDYVYLTSEAAIYLAEKNIMLLGIDYLSVKQRGAPDNTAHTALLANNIPIVEGLNLKDILEGAYFLICLPLKFTGLDGAPARAVLLK